jgi:PLP dependent protein
LMHVGENRVQDLLAKLDHIPTDMQVQFIGRLQTNKVNKLVGRVESIASVDRPELLEKIAGRAAELSIVQRIWIQANISGEDQKGGCAPAQVAQLWERGLESSALEPVGLMGMGSRGAGESALRESFSKLRDLGRELPVAQRVRLSMGMSGDYAIAIEEGATQLRLGSVLFGPRG